MNEIIQGDCLEVMKTFPDNHFSAIVTDPPYGLSFMGKGWDHAVPGIDYWRECFRIVRPGSFLLAMGGTRTFHRLTCAIEDAGFEIRDCISWLYGSGFPKSHNHFGIEGYGTALKPAWEPCIMAMKPLDGTFAQNAEKWGQAGINIDGCRIGTEENLNGGAYSPDKNKSNNVFGKLDYNCGQYEQPKGRWPANLIIDEEAAAMLDEQTARKLHLSGQSYAGNHSKSIFSGFGDSDRGNRVDFRDSYTGASRFFYCAKTSSRERNEGLDELSGKKTTYMATANGTGRPSVTVDDQGEQRDRFSSINKNFHPCVKPLALMRYLITLVAPPTNALILDPFAGSGSTILAAKQLGISAIGIEKQQEYAEIARTRLNAVETNVAEEKQMELFA